MEPRKLNVLIATFPYAGNGGISSQSDEVADWLAETLVQGHADPRIGWIKKRKFSDTPIPMTRNASVLEARKMGADVLVMVDSDMDPDRRFKAGDPTAKPFFKTAFDHLYDHWEKGPVVVGAPYCGPPPKENCYVFRWATRTNCDTSPDAYLDQYTREEAAMRMGIEDCAALPTGLIMYDMRIFDVCEPKDKRQFVGAMVVPPFAAKLKAGTLTEADLRLMVDWVLDERYIAEQSWFYYHYKDKYQSAKSGTEDVMATRDFAFIGSAKLGYNPVQVAWDCWAGHWKVKCVDKPIIIGVSEIEARYHRAVEEGLDTDFRDVDASAFAA